MADWVTVEVNLNPIVTKASPLLQTLDSILSFLIGVLNVVQAILNVIKVFLVGFLDPIRAIVELLIEEVRSLIADLRQMGVYITGDWALLHEEGKFGNLVGGYQAYERRMLARLQDRSDPNRPDFSSSTAVLGAFFYASSSDINDLFRIINSFLKFFGQSDLAGRGAPFGRPTAPEMQYGTEGASQAAFRKLAVASRDAIPDAVSVSWTMPSGAAGGPRFLSPAPKGFLIHASTIPDGFKVVAEIAKDDLSSNIEGTGSSGRGVARIVAAAVDPTTNGPLRLYGGVADIGVAGDSTDFITTDPTTPFQNPQKSALLLQKDQNTPLIPPGVLNDDGRPLVADTYYVRTKFLTRTGAGTRYTATFPRNLLPQAATFEAGENGYAQVASTYEPTTYYFRIRALTEDYTDQLDQEMLELNPALANPVSVFGNTEVRPYRFSAANLRSSRNGVFLPESAGRDGAAGNETLTFNSFTAASGPGVAEFPTAAQAKYIQAVQAAIALAVLCRADLTEASLNDDTGFPMFSQNMYAPGQNLLGLEGAGRDLIARYGIQPVWFRGNRPVKFRLAMRNLMSRIASDLQGRAAPPDSLASAIGAEADTLLNFQWSLLSGDYPQLTVLQSIGVFVAGETPEDQVDSLGVGSNPYCRSLPRNVITAIYSDFGKRNSIGDASLTSLLGTKGITEGVIPDRSPSFMWSVAEGQSPIDLELQPQAWIPGQGSADFSPIIYNDSTLRVEYIRNAMLNSQEGLAALAAATTVLQLAGAAVSRPIGDTQWIAVRVMPQAFAPMDDLLDRLDRFLQGILDGLDGIVEKIVAYIEAVQARIYQLQALLEQIRALLRSLDFFSLPLASGLVIVESGTDGVTTGLLTATNKPDDAASSYGGGIAVVAGGLPSVLLELLALILSGGDEGA